MNALTLRASAKSPALALALALTFGLAAGCGHDHDHDHADHDDEGPAHVIPAHRPVTFPDGVRSLRAYHERIGKTLAEGGETPDPAALAEALDVAKWLPEIAAESDMPEAPWDAVSRDAGAVAEALDGLLARVKGGAKSATDPAAWLKDAGRGIAALEATLASSEPAWFADGDRVAASR
ncbi:MAG: hypothetical protein K2X91_02720 [Thermoleophilia bacterium]|nr:hypothetical protein [Thermoleophilia bacterium]